MAEAFVDEDAGPEVMQKVQRRLQHFIDRKVATLFEPLLAMSRDEAITGLARGFAFRLVEALGILPRAEVAEEVKALDQEARGQLRKHGVRFGQFTIFQQLLLKPAPTRLRLVLWGLANDHAEFFESPPPGLVTIPAVAGAPRDYYTNSGYRLAGSRAIRIDMLERLADMLRGQDSRGGFEATADMLSITGMTLEQFADLMEGLGYKAEKGERVKVKAVETPDPQGPTEVPGDAPPETPEPPAETPAEPPAEAPVEPPVETPETPPSEVPGTSARPGRRAPRAAPPPRRRWKPSIRSHGRRAAVAAASRNAARAAASRAASHAARAARRARAGRKRRAATSPGPTPPSPRARKSRSTPTTPSRRRLRG